MCKSKTKKKLWSLLKEGDWLVVPINEVVRNGQLIMEAGLAKAANEELLSEGKRLSLTLGNYYKEASGVHIIEAIVRKTGRKINLVTLPTKGRLIPARDVSEEEVLPKYRQQWRKLKEEGKFIEGWKLKSSIKLIERSFRELTTLLSLSIAISPITGRLFLPIVGIGAGNLSIHEVAPLYREYLPQLKVFFSNIILFSKDPQAKELIRELKHLT